MLKISHFHGSIETSIIHLSGSLTDQFTSEELRVINTQIIPSEWSTQLQELFQQERHLIRKRQAFMKQCNHEFATNPAIVEKFTNIRKYYPEAYI